MNEKEALAQLKKALAKLSEEGRAAIEKNPVVDHEDLFQVNPDDAYDFGFTDGKNLGAMEMLKVISDAVSVISVELAKEPVKLNPAHMAEERKEVLGYWVSDNGKWLTALSARRGSEWVDLLTGEVSGPPIGWLPVSTNVVAPSGFSVEKEVSNNEWLDK